VILAADLLEIVAGAQALNVDSQPVPTPQALYETPMRLAATSPTQQVAAFTIPSSSSALSIKLKVLTGGSAEYVRVTMGSGTTAVILGNLNVGGATNGTVTQFLAIPASLRTSTAPLPLKFELVSGATTAVAVAEVSAFTPVGDLMGLNGDRLKAMQAGIAAVDRFTENLGALREWAGILPFGIGDKPEAKISDLIDVTNALKTLVTSRVNQYLSTATNATAAGLNTFLRAAQLPNFAVQFGAVSVVSTDGEVRVGLSFTANRTIGGLRIARPQRDHDGLGQRETLGRPGVRPEARRHRGRVAERVLRPGEKAGRGSGRRRQPAEREGPRRDDRGRRHRWQVRGEGRDRFRGGPTYVLSSGTVEFKLKLHRDATITTGALGFDLGMPGLGLNLNNTQLAFSAGFDFDLGFGVSKGQGFYLITNPNADELRVTVSADATAFDATGTLGIFKVQAKKIAGSPIHAGATFSVDLNDPSGTDNRVTLADLRNTPISRLFDARFVQDAQGRESGVDMNIDVRAGFSNPNLPAITTVLRVKWVFGQPAATTNTLTGAPTIRFDDVKAQLSELLKNTSGPVLTNVNKVLAPVKPLINVL
jgi:hypothetical protein